MSATEPASSSAAVSIGDVLDQLRPEFADITISKIRFLESQGLIDPERTPSGYRKFSPADIERLRFILREQREHFLPLKVIKERLDQLDRGETPRTAARSPPSPTATRRRRRASASRWRPSRCSRWPGAPPMPTTRARQRRPSTTPKSPTTTAWRRPR